METEEDWLRGGIKGKRGERMRGEEGRETVVSIKIKNVVCDSRVTFLKEKKMVRNTTGFRKEYV